MSDISAPPPPSEFEDKKCNKIPIRSVNQLQDIVRLFFSGLFFTKNLVVYIDLDPPYFYHHVQFVKKEDTSKIADLYQQNLLVEKDLEETNVYEYISSIDWSSVYFEFKANPKDTNNDCRISIKLEKDKGITEGWMEVYHSINELDGKESLLL